MVKKVFFVTNHAGKTPTEAVAKMKRMGFVKAKESQVYTMARVMAQYVRRTYPQVRKALVIGMKAMREMLEAEGIEVLGAE